MESTTETQPAQRKNQNKRTQSKNHGIIGIHTFFDFPGNQKQRMFVLISSGEDEAVVRVCARET